MDDDEAMRECYTAESDWGNGVSQEWHSVKASFR
jgi:hypothetical protein